MSMTYQEALEEEWYDRLVQEIIEQNRPDIISEHVRGKMKWYYAVHSDCFNAPRIALKKAGALLNVDADASLVFSNSCIELAMHDIILKPMFFGMIHDEDVGESIIGISIRHQALRKFMLLTVLKDYGIDLQDDNLWEKVVTIGKIRNYILHKGESVSLEQAEKALATADTMLSEVCGELRRKLVFG